MLFKSHVNSFKAYQPIIKEGAIIQMEHFKLLHTIKQDNIV